jgi:hypothetical protein
MHEGLCARVTASLARVARAAGLDFRSRRRPSSINSELYTEATWKSDYPEYRSGSDVP